MFSQFKRARKAVCVIHIRRDSVLLSALQPERFQFGGDCIDFGTADSAVRRNPHLAAHQLEASLSDLTIINTTSVILVYIEIKKERVYLNLFILKMAKPTIVSGRLFRSLATSRSEARLKISKSTSIIASQSMKSAGLLNQLFKLIVLLLYHLHSLAAIKVDGK